MKYSGGNPSTLFCEQVSTVTSLFEKWNDCERTVVMYALLKRLRYPSLKFLQYSIESNLAQNFGSQNNLTASDINANSPIYLKKLVNAYKSFPVVELSQLTDQDPILYGSDMMLQENGKNYGKREDVLSDILGMLPLLRPGNEEAKAVYLSLIPLAVEDTVRQIVRTDLVQQIFSYLLIHPAITNEDRRSLSHWLRHLEEHIQSSFASGQQSFYVLSNATDGSSKSASVSSVSSVNSRSNWQAIAPPSQASTQKHHLSHSTTIPIVPGTSDWNVGVLQMPDSLCEDIQLVNLNDTAASSSQNSLGLVYDGSTSAVCNQSTISNDDHHVSFSKNGTEIIDFEINSCDKCNTQIGYNSLLANVCDHVDAPRWSLDSKMTAIKTRRSNSLTTAISSSSSSTSSVITVNDNCSNSSENLAQYAQKPRSYSLSIENPRGSLASSGSDTRLDDLKPSYLKFTTHNIGMSNIGQWLKSLRLHKYIGLFTNMTYEDMLGITEDYLQSLGVTKGASHKLALCIEKLKDRFNHLTKIEQDLISNTMTINAAIDELTNIVLTPMKPADSSPNNVATKFLQGLDFVSHAIAKKEISSTQDEESVNALLWILERSIHSEAFVAHTNQLKEHKFKLSKLKMQFAPKNHHSKNGSNTSLNKPRWSGKTRKNDKCGSNDRINRKNSSDLLNFSLSPLQQTSTITSNNNSQSLTDTEKFHCTKSSPQAQNLYNIPPGTSSSTCPQYKSSSYPNFSNSGKIGQQQQQQLQPQQQQQYRNHRHSFNNLIVVSANCQQLQQLNFKPKKPTMGVLNLNKSCTSANTTATTTPNNNGISDCQNRRSSLTKAGAPITALIAPNIPIGKTAEPVAAATTSQSESCIANSSKVVTSLVSSTKSGINGGGVSSTSSSSNLGKDKNVKNSIGDINSSLEFLCLQMTEQAIN